MGKVNINLTTDAVLVPEGTYAVEVVQLTAKESAAGDIYLPWDLMIRDRGYNGGRLQMISSLRPDMLRLLRRPFAILDVDVDTENGVDIEWDDVSAEAFARRGARVTSPPVEGAEAYAVVVHDEWEGEPRAKVRRLPEAV